MPLTASILEVCVPSGIFCWRNIQKFENGEKARGTVAIAQGAKVAQAVSKYNETVAKTASSASNVFRNMAKESKVIDYTGKAVKWATKNVNPLICASGVVKVAVSDDKVGTAITETGALAGMFAGEGIAKRVLPLVFNEKNITTVAKSMGKTKFLKPISEFLLKSGNSSKAAAILKGIAFVCASIASYNVGRKLAEPYAGRVKAGMGIKTEKEENKKIDQKA